MNLVDQMKKNSKNIHQKCIGEGFLEEEKSFLKEKACKRIDRYNEIYNPNTGVLDEEKLVKISGECKCTAYTNPEYWWKNGRYCPLASHYKPESNSEKIVTRVGQQKQKKRF